VALSRVGPLSILKIRGTNPLTLVDGGRDLKRKAEGLDELIGKQVHAVQELEQEWKGKAANAPAGRPTGISSDSTAFTRSPTRWPRP